MGAVLGSFWLETELQFTRTGRVAARLLCFALHRIIHYTVQFTTVKELFNSVNICQSKLVYREIKSGTRFMAHDVQRRRRV